MLSPFRTLAGRILLLFLALFVLVEVVAFIGLDRARMQSARAMITEDLAAGGESFDRQMQARLERFFLAARVLSGDFGFKKAFGSRHKPTLLAAMQNHAERLGADVMLVVSLEGGILADAQHPRGQEAPFPYPALLEAAEREGSASGLVIFGDRLCHVVVFPLLAPAPAAWICIGYPLDDAFAMELKKLISLDVTFVREQGGERQRVAGSSLEGERRGALAEVLRAAGPAPGGTLSFTLGGERHLGLSRGLEQLGGPHAGVVLQRSLDLALAPYHRVRRIQLLIFAGGLAGLFAGGLLISALVTRRLRRLAAGVESIERGDYGQPLVVEGKDELARLSRAFNLMRDAIVKREEKMLHQAGHDELTGLLNRSGLRRRLEELLAAGPGGDAPFALIVMNLDRFITVITALGYEAGNAILQKVGTLLGRATPEGAVMARLHADVFAILTGAGTDVAGAVRIVQEVQRLFETPFWFEDVPVQIEARFGIVACPIHGADADTLLRRVDVAVHHARQAPGGITVYSPEHDGNSRRQLALLGELRHAIDRRELTMHFQPKVHFGSGRIAGLEALIRWKHAQFGFVPPDEFIGLCEGTGLIRPVTEWTLDAAIGECAALNQRGLPLSMAVNLSARSLQDEHLPDLVAALVGRHNVPAGQITLELTESAIMADPKGTMGVVNRLDAMGIRLAVDDFGTGYSSLAYLQRLPVDELKIDKSFVMHMDARENDAVIVRTIIELGHNLGFEVTAEGVETREVWQLLKTHGCDLAQGYLHGRPMPMAEFVDWAELSPWGLGARG